MKKIIIRIFWFCFVLALVLPSVSCNRGLIRDAETGDAEDTRSFDASVNITGYTVIRGEKAGKGDIAVATKLRAALESATGVRIKIADDWTKPGESTDYSQKYEILVGQTNRPESAEASVLLDKPGYIIKIIGNKIVIAASSDALLDVAADFFINTYLATASTDGVIKLYGEYI